MANDKYETLYLPKDWKLVKLADITTKIGSGSTPRGGESAYIASRQ